MDRYMIGTGPLSWDNFAQKIECVNPNTEYSMCWDKEILVADLGPETSLEKVSYHNNQPFIGLALFIFSWSAWLHSL